MRQMISPMLSVLLLLSASSLFAVNGATALGIDTVAARAAAVDNTANQLTAWLERAPSTAPIVCSVDRTLAPESVAMFEQISAKISALYARIYEEVRAVSVAGVQLPADTLNTSSPKAQDGSRARQQATITANYQATLQEIEQHRKELTRYTDALRTEPSIAGFASRIQQTIILTQFGRNAFQLGEQLKAAGEGAILVLQQRLNATQDE